MKSLWSIRFFCATFLFSISLTMFGVFIAMWIVGVVKVCEPNTLVRLTEILMFLLFVIISVLALRKEIVEMSNKP